MMYINGFEITIYKFALSKWICKYNNKNNSYWCTYAFIIINLN